MPKKKTTAFEDLITFTSRLPWWVGIVLALVSYVALSTYANQETIVHIENGRPADLSGFTFGIFFKAIASFGQYLFPFAFLIGSGLSGYQRIKRKGLLSRVSSHDAESKKEGGDK